MAPRALMTGIGGQDGSYLAEQLLSHGYEVAGTVLGSPEASESLAPVRDRIRFMQIELEDVESVRRGFREFEPDEIYHLASASFVPASWDDPVATSTAAVAAVSALLEGVRQERPKARFVNASSAEIFGAPHEIPQHESTPVAPLTPYGAAKAFGHFLTGAFRRRYGLHASSAILFNHESPRRPDAVPDPQGHAAERLRSASGSRTSSGSATSRRDGTGALPATTCARCG